jgi:hypothetical protein
MVRRSSVVALFLLLSFFLIGCPKKPPPPLLPVEKPPFVNPISRVLEILSFAETLQARASIRIDMVRNGEKEYYVLNGLVMYQNPDRLRILGYHPLGMGLFDALYRSGEFSLLIPLQKVAFSGEVAQSEEAMRKVGEIRVNAWKDEMRDIPNRVQIRIVDKEIEIELRLKEIQVNRELPEDAFHWGLPEGVQERPLSGLLGGIK